MNRALIGSHKDGANTQVPDRSSIYSLVFKPPEARDFDATTHIHHVAWKSRGTGIRVVQNRNGRYFSTGRCPTSANKAGAPNHDHAGQTGPGARTAPTPGPIQRSADRTGGGCHPTDTKVVSPPTLTSRLSHPVVILTAKWSQTTGEQRSGHSRSQQKG